MTEATVEIPGAGRVPRNVLLVLGAAGAGFVGYSYYRRRQQAAPTATQDVNSGVGAVQYTGSANVAGATGNATITAGSTDGITTNAQWVQAATTYLEQHANYDGAALATALGKYIARDPGGLSDAEVSMVMAARGAFGDPPANGPFTIIHAPKATTPPPSDNGDFTTYPADPSQEVKPPNAVPHFYITKSGDTLLGIVSKIYGFDPSVNPPTDANLQKRIGVANAIYGSNLHVVPPGIQTPLPGGIEITYY
jgi:nucleoid-associated protein YgaU